MNTKDFIRLGVPLGQATRRATDFISRFILGGGDRSRLEEEVKAIVANPAAFADDPLRKDFAAALLSAPPPPRATPVKYRQWGEGLEHEAVMQMERACLLPVAVAGALMPDAHVGYGLPIGGVLATDNAVIPYASLNRASFNSARLSFSNSRFASWVDSNARISCTFSLSGNASSSVRMAILSNVSTNRMSNRSIRRTRMRSGVWGSKKISVGLYVPLLG